MRKLLFIPGCLMTCFIYAQNIEMVSSSITLPDADEKSYSSAEMTLYNPGAYSVEVTDIDLFELYGHLPFTVSDTAFMLMPGDTFTFSVFFLPEHNVWHDMALVIKTSSGFGHKAVEIEGQGKYSMAYYSSTENKSEEALKSALKAKLAQGYHSLGYTTARDHMYGSIDNSGGSVSCVYTGRSATFNTRSGANNNNFNCEHTFPQGFFDSDEPMRSDIHHLFPTDITANSQRGNDPFGVVNNASWESGGSKSGGGRFEPRDLHKGTCARAMMYFVIRYRDYASHFAGQENILRSWHRLFPPNANDSMRNEAIAQLQTSRNPFVDYPQFEERIASFVSNSVAPEVEDLYFSDDTINVLRAGGRQEYEFVCYNNGSEVISLSDFSMTDTSLHFVPSSPASISVNPGDAVTLKISYDGSRDYNAEMSLSTSMSSQPVKTIPIRSGAKIGTPEYFIIRELKAFPNPTKGLLYIEGLPDKGLQRIWLNNSTGLTIELPLTDIQNLSNLSPGLYFLCAKTKEGDLRMQKIIVQ